METTRHFAIQRLGELLTAQGTLRPEQVQELLERQKQESNAHVWSLLGELAVRAGWADADEIMGALRAQSQGILEHAGLGETLVALGYLTPAQLQQALESRLDVSEPLEEVVVERGFCTPQQVRVALHLLAIRRNAALRRQVCSTFVPFNIMELLVVEQVGDVLKQDGGCRCTQCWMNVFALALNLLPPRYISEHTRILDCVQRFRREYDELVREKLVQALQRVRANPKASCRSRFSDDLLSGRPFVGEVYEVVVHISNRHVHLCPADISRLFGEGYQLRVLKPLMQPGQFAAQETVTLVGPKGEIPHVRVLGPARPQSQVEISGTDQFVLGIAAPVRESGDLAGTPGIRIRSEAGQLDLACGTIRALRHVHMLPADADRMGLQNGDRVTVRLMGDRTTICEGVLIRATPNSALEMHIDTDEANAAGLPSESIGQILVPAPTC